MYKVKLANRFNTIEWESEDIPETDDLNCIYKLLESIEIEGDWNACKTTEKKDEVVPLASDKQVEVLTKMGYKNAAMMTKREAWEIINKAYSK